MTRKEKALARKVFKSTLPYGTIWLSNASGLGRRACTLPHPLHAGGYVIHIGPEIFRDATNASVLAFNQRADGVFIHELTHVWQGCHSRNPLDYIVDSLYHQISEGARAFDVNDADIGVLPWRKLRAEQQASVVQAWFVRGMSKTAPAFKYIRDNIRTGTA